MRELLSHVRGEDDGACACEPSFEDDSLLVDADDCSGGGTLADSPACRATAIAALADRDADAVVTRADGIERAYEGEAAALLVAAGRFVERVAFHDEGIAARAKRDPLRAASDAVGRAGRVGELLAETGLAETARRVEGYGDGLRPFVGPILARSRVATRPPEKVTLDGHRSLDSGATARIYADDRSALRIYHLEPIEHTFEERAHRTLRSAHELLASGAVSGGKRAPGRAVRQVAEPDDPVAKLTDVLRKHTRGYGVLADLFADPDVSDVFATAPVTENRLRVTVDGESMRTNVRLTGAGAQALASRFRRTSGRAFSRASPTLDAVANPESGDDRVRVAGVTEPVSRGPGFAFRAHDEAAWTLPALVENGTLPAGAAALLSVAVERATAGLVAGSRGAGKTTLLGALLWELPAATRTVVIEDTLELPISALQRQGRDVQSLRTATGDGDPGLGPVEALQTALRLGEGALVVGEVRSEEAAVLYEAMRVGASGSAVLGTIHGDGAAEVRERVVSDLAVPASSFGATDLIVTLESYDGPDGGGRRVKAIEEVVSADEGVRFEPLYGLRSNGLDSTDRIDRGNSVLVAELARGTESYSDVRTLLADREREMASLADDGRTSAETVNATYAASRGGDRS